MPMIEVDENEYRALVQNSGVIKAVEQMMANPAARKKLLEARKVADPTASIPEIDAAAPVEAAVSEVTKTVAELRAEMAADKTERENTRRLDALNSRWEKGRQTLRDEGYTEEGIAAIEKVMEAEGIANHVAGAAYYDKINPAPEPVTPTSTRFDIFAAPSKDESMKMLHDGDEDGFLNQTIAAIRGESKQTQRR